jgi:aminoglycoside 3-N-acetyltransferase
VQLSNLKFRVRDFLVSRFLSYGPDDFLKTLEKLGIKAGDAVMVHASMANFNGFTGRPIDMIDVLKKAVTYDGLLIMPSMSYSGSSKSFLAQGKPLDVRRTPSQMGLLSEIFRRHKDVQRSINPAHPLLAWGQRSDWFLAGHQNCAYSFGMESPFAKLEELNGKILCIDVGYEFVTFTHFVEDRISDRLPFPLYDAEPMSGIVIDSAGQQHNVQTYVLSDASRKLRREEKLVAALKKGRKLLAARIGNTSLLAVNCRDIVNTAEEMLANGESFFASP